jgi:putative sigma-54 modulation protein
MQANVTLDMERIEHCVEVRISSGAEHYHGREQSEDMYASIDVVVDKLERQIRSGKGVSVARKRHAQGTGEFAAAAVVAQKADHKE